MASQTPTAAQMKDVDSRFMLQTKTEGTHHWDQVTGISQRLINDNFENLAVLYPQMRVIDTSLKKSRMKAKLLAPRVLIPAGSKGNNNYEILFLIKFESGAIHDKEGEELIDDLAGWVIAFSINLNNFSDDESKQSKTDDPYETATQKKHVESLRKSLTINGKQLPGDYSVERLYAKLSSAKFSDPDKTHSKAIVEGKVVSWDEWSANNFNEYHELKGFLEKWAIEQDNEGRNVFGYGIQLKNESQPFTPTFVPTDLVHQTYTYKQADVCKDGTTGDTLLGSRNALLYCEMTRGKPRPDEHKLVWSGNFCTMPSTADAKDAIEGTYILTHTRFLDEFLLPILRQLNQATEVCHGLPYGEQKDQIVPSPMPYNVCYDPQNPSVNSPCYDFKNLNPTNELDLPTGYRFHKVNFQPQPEGSYVEFKNSHPTGANLKGARVRNEMSVDVTWAMGTPTLTVSGKVFTAEIAYWDQGGAIKPGDPATWGSNDLWCWMNDSFTGTWEMTLTLRTIDGANNNGILDVKIDTGPNKDCNFKIEAKRDHHNMKENGHFEAVEADLRKRFVDIVPKIEKKIRESLQGSGRFFFPGSGIFSFQNPRFTKWGDLVAEINYLPLEKGSMILIPAPVKPLDIPAPCTKPKLNVLTAPLGSHMLSWSSDPNPCFLESNTIGKLAFRGTNEKAGVVGFKEIRFLFTSKKKAGNLFYTDTFYCKGVEPQKKPEEPKPTKPESTTTKPVSTDLETTTSTTTQTNPSDESHLKSEKDFIIVDAPTETAASTSKTVTVNPTSNNFTSNDSKIPPSVPTAGSDHNSKMDEPADGAKEPSLLHKIKEGLIQLADAFLPSGEPDFGVVSIRHNVSEAKPIVTVICQNAKKFKDATTGRWQVTVRNESGTLYLKPGEWIEVIIEARSSMPAAYKVTVDEEFSNPKDTHWSEEFTVKIK